MYTTHTHIKHDESTCIMCMSHYVMQFYKIAIKYTI